MNRKVKVLIVVSVVTIMFILIAMNFDFRLDRFGTAKISWVNCVQINNTKYYKDYDNGNVEASAIGKKIGKVTFRVSEKVSNPKYRFRDGDATFLDIGTEIYSISGMSNAIAVKIGEQYYLYSIMK